ncbi:hypothetical protein GCM10023228_03010 [Brevibacillus fulvus]
MKERGWDWICTSIAFGIFEECHLKAIEYQDSITFAIDQGADSCQAAKTAIEHMRMIPVSPQIMV